MRDLAPLWATLAALLLVGSPLTAQMSGDETESETKQVTVVARESGCPDDEDPCLSIEDSPSSLSQGDEVNLTFRNAEDNEGTHNVHVTMNASADPEHQDTSSEDAVANTTTIAPGEHDSLTFTVPDGEALYLWCDVGGHEAGGMWTTIAVQEENATENGTENDTRENETSENGTEDDTRENGTEENQTTRDESEPEPLEPTEDEPRDDGEPGRQAPLGPPLLIAALVAAAVGLAVSRHA